MFYYFIMGWRDREWPISRLSQGLFGPRADRLPTSEHTHIHIPGKVVSMQEVSEV